MPKKTIAATIIAVALAYLAGLLNYPYFCLAMLVLTFYGSLISIFLACMSLTCPKVLDDLRKKRSKLIPAAVICVVIFKISAWAVSNYYLLSASSDLRFVAKASIFVTALIIAMHIVTGRCRKTMLSLGILIIISSVIAPFISPPNLGSQNKRKPDWKALNSIPYLDTVAEDDENIPAGVTFHNPAKAYQGINIWFAVSSNQAHLMDMEGNNVHTWSFGKNDKLDGDALLCRNGDLLCATQTGILKRLDWDSNVKWCDHEYEYHHEIGTFKNGDVFSLGKKAEVIFIAGLPLPIRNDSIVTLTKDGKVKETTSLLDVLRDEFSTGTVIRTYWHLLQPGCIKQMLKHQLALIKGERANGYITLSGTIFDNLHANTITLMDRKVEGLCNKDDLLICIRNWDMIAIMDSMTKKLKWQWYTDQGGRPHHATLLENDNILLFDNGLLRRYSRVVEIDPATKEIVWEYKATPSESFFSKVRSGAQRLPNGNTLITESRKGRAFEVTPQGDLVWDFYSSQLNPKKERRPTIYRVLRIVEPEKYSFLDEIK